MDGDNQVFSMLVDDFNEYAKNNNIDIEVKLSLSTMENATINIDDYGSVVETLLKKKENKYDIYIYDGLYSRKYGPYLYDLRNIFSEDYLNLYDENIIEDKCKYNDKIVSVVIMHMIK